MKLAIFKRETLKKGDTKRLRREGNIPAVLYGASQSNENVYLKNDEMQAILRGLKSGLLATTVFELVDGKKTHKAVIKDVQYHVTSYAIQHIDFAILSDNAPVSVNVPIQILGSAECARFASLACRKTFRKSLRWTLQASMSISRKDSPISQFRRMFALLRR